ncbi:TPA: lysine--tRNA ligase [Candidatus Beckwithbacteria bacterium]|nr:lysine--tRNA ligase [Candidatus Beckwithbacteria bacterium]
MFWADKLASDIVKSGKHKPLWVDDMKTPSGRVHVGALRGVVVHGLVYQALIKEGQKATYSYVINDMDPMDGFPNYLPIKFKKHMGEPLFKIPSPEKGYQSMGQAYGQQFIDTFNRLGFKPKIIWSSQWYKQGKFDAVIRQVLDRVDLVRKLYHDISGYDKPKSWYPYQVICPQCGKVGTTIATSWDGKKVGYECKKDLVVWAEGCGHKGEVEPKGLAGKLMWKVDWAAHWKVIGVTVEGAGKDHMSQGGSYDLSSAICEKVLDYPKPFAFLYEWFLAKGGSKMSSSRGIGVSASQMAETLPPEILRFLLVKTPRRKAIIFDPNNNETVLNLFDAYDQAAEAYFNKSDPLLARVFELSQPSGKTPKKIFLPRFRDVVKLLQDPKVDEKEKFAEIKGGKLTPAEERELERRVKYAKIWLSEYAPEEQVFQMTKILPETTATLSAEQKTYLQTIVKVLDKDWQDADQLQQELYQTAKKMKLVAGDAFGAIYISLLNKSHGPKAAWLILDEGKDKVANRLKQAAEYQVAEVRVAESKYPVIKAPKFVSINPDMAKAYPSIKVAMAVIRGVNNKVDNDRFVTYRNQVVDSLNGITLDDISASRKISSYRKAIRESGIDWHKRRPTMEALLRRVAQGKQLYWINPLVDIGNLMAMKHQASQGVFDLDQVKLPAIMRKSGGGEKVLMLGDTKPITLQKGEICYFDRQGPFIVDLCWRDAKRTGATEKTRDVMFLSEAVYDISRKDLDDVLDDLIATVTRYLGGKVETAGIVTANK